MFVQIGDDRYSCVAPPGFEKDPSVTAAIQEFDPGVIPIWRIQRWRFPGERRETLVVHHGIGRYYPYPRHIRRPFPVVMPAGAEYPAPNFLDAIFEDTHSPSYTMGGPGVYMPWDWSIYYWCREKFTALTAARFDELVQAHRERLEAMRRAWEEEVERRKKDIEPTLMKKLATVSDYDWKQLMAFHAENDRRRKMGLQPIRRNGAKPMVVVGRAAGRSPRSRNETYGRVAPSRGE